MSDVVDLYYKIPHDITGFTLEWYLYGTQEYKLKNILIKKLARKLAAERTTKIQMERMRKNDIKHPHSTFQIGD